jgi:hypothetical protein
MPVYRSGTSHESSPGVNRLPRQELCWTRALSDELSYFVSRAAIA